MGIIESFDDWQFSSIVSNNLILLTVGVPLDDDMKALSDFQLIKLRMRMKYLHLTALITVK